MAKIDHRLLPAIVDEWKRLAGRTAERMREPLTEFAGLYNLTFTVRALPLNDSLLLLGFAAALGWLGAWLSVSRHLREV